MVSFELECCRVFGLVVIGFWVRVGIVADVETHWVLGSGFRGGFGFREFRVLGFGVV